MELARQLVAAVAFARHGVRKVTGETGRAGRKAGRGCE